MNYNQPSAWGSVIVIFYVILVFNAAVKDMVFKQFTLG